MGEAGSQGTGSQSQGQGQQSAGGGPIGGPTGRSGAPSGNAEGQAGTSEVPSDVGDGRDDDIVARQLREAAMNEKDPVLREKLWEEYRTYKTGVDE
jgi:hypothetical protein